MKDDMRVIRTQRSIRAAFLRLLAEKKYENITVQDIAKEAFVNRNTFYLHYIDKADLLEKLSTECLDDLQKCLVVEEVSEVDDDYVYTIIRDVLNAIEKNKEFYKIMMVESDSAFFTEKLTATLRKSIYPYVYNSESEEKRLFVEYLIAGFIGVVRMYLRSDKISNKKLSDVLFKVLYQDSHTIFLKTGHTRTHGDGAKCPI